MTFSPATIAAWYAFGVLATRAVMDLLKPDCPWFPKSLPLGARTWIASGIAILNALFLGLQSGIPVGTAIATAMGSLVTALVTHQMIPDDKSDPDTRAKLGMAPLDASKSQSTHQFTAFAMFLLTTALAGVFVACGAFSGVVSPSVSVGVCLTQVGTSGSYATFVDYFAAAWAACGGLVEQDAVAFLTAIVQSVDPSVSKFAAEAKAHLADASARAKLVDYAKAKLAYKNAARAVDAGQ